MAAIRPATLMNPSNLLEGFLAGALIAACAGDTDALRAAFDLPKGEARHRAGREASECIAKHASAAVWAQAQHHLPHEGREAGARELCRFIDKWVSPPKDQDFRRRDLTWLAVDLLDTGMPTAEVLRRVVLANASLCKSLPAQAVMDILKRALQMSALPVA